MNWWNNKQIRVALWFLGGLLFVALVQDFLANGRPLYCRIGGESFFPGLHSVLRSDPPTFRHPVLNQIQEREQWRQYRYDVAVFAPVAFSPGEIPGSSETMVRNAPPGTLVAGPARAFRHWLGTDSNGYDVAAGLIGGARVAVLTALIAMCMAFGIGLLLGALAGFWGDDGLLVRRGRIWMMLAGLPFAVFYASVVFSARLTPLPFWQTALVRIAVFLGILLLFNRLGGLLFRWPYFARRVAFPVDLVVMRFEEIFVSMPGLLVIIAFAVLLKAQTRSLWAMIMLIGAFSWTGIARYIRAELLRIRELDYVTAARGLGLSEWRILWKHALPNALRPAYTALAFGMASSILLEATLSFLGFGDPNLQGATWGSLLQNAHGNSEHWWASTLPGLLICLTLMSLHGIGEALSERR